MDYYSENKNESGRPIKQEKVNTKKVIYLGGLPADVDKYELNQFILKQGKFNIEEMMTHGGAKSFAYIKFKTKEEAAEALKVLHLKEFKNHIIKAEPFTSTKKKNKENTNLFVKNLPKDCTPKELYDIFVKFGEIDSINLKKDHNGNFLGYGYVDFVSEENAKEAINKLNQTKFKDSTISVSLFTPKEKRMENLNNNEYLIPMLIARKIPDDMSSASFKNVFDIYGQIMISGIINEPLLISIPDKEKEKNEPVNKYGIILYTKKEEAETALSQLEEKYDLVLLPSDQNIIEKVKKQKHDSMKAKYEGCNLVVKNLPKEVDDKILFEIFIKYGPISSARVQTQGVMKDIKDEKGNIIDKKYIYESKGFGFVLFKKEEDARNAKMDLNEKEFEHNGIKLKLIVENFDYNKGERSKIEQIQRDMGMLLPRGRGHQQRGRGGFNPNMQGRGRGRGGRGRGNAQMMNNNYMNNNMGNMGNNMMVNNMMNMNNQQQMNNMFGNNTPMQQKQIIPQNKKITVESENLVEKITEKLKIEDPDERTEAIGEILFYFLLQFIPQYGLNITGGKFNDSDLCSKLTGILIKTDPRVLLQIISKNESLFNSLSDVLQKLMNSNNLGDQQ